MLRLYLVWLNRQCPQELIYSCQLQITKKWILQIMLTNWCFPAIKILAVLWEIGHLINDLIAFNATML